MKKILFIYCLLAGSAALAQTVFEPPSSAIYSYLNRLSVKGFIRFDDELKPLSRNYIAGKLQDVSKLKNKLTKIEKDELEYFIKEFAVELSLLKTKTPREEIQFFSFEDTTGFRFLLFRNEDFTLNLDPIYGYSVKHKYSEFQTHRWNGLQFSGYYKNNWGFYFYFRDNEEKGLKIDRTKEFTNEPGINVSQSTAKTIEYVDVQGLLSYSWTNGNISIGKQNFDWGSGIGGKLIFSNKAPSFPFIRFEINPVEWLKFVYFHGWLHSALLDSSTIRKTLVDTRESYSQREKFIASHMVSIYPIKNLSISLGESIVYSDKIEFAYFIPVLFFRMVDHYIDKDSSNTGDNAQLFFNASYKLPEIRSKFYTTLFIDELSITNLLKGTNLSAVGITAGFNVIDPVLENSEFSFEYSRLNPFVYMNSNDAQLFTSHKYQLGHWIGSNAHQIYAEYIQYILRGLSVKLWGERIQKGQKELPEDQYKLPYPNFLYGERLTINKLGLQIHYDVFHNLFARMSYIYSNTSDQNPLRTAFYQLGKQNIFELSLGYGF